ncbi:MAG: hypothetical protein ABIQ16_05300 [Polyangiaceae bacterium]
MSFVSEREMNAVSPEIYGTLPVQFRDQLPAEVKASAQNSDIFHATFSFDPKLVDALFDQLRYDHGGDWPMWKLVACFYMVEKRIGPNTVRKAGERVFSTMPWPPQVKSLADALRFTEVAYFESHLRAPKDRAGCWRVELEKPGRTILTDATPYPCNANEGVVSGICMAFAKQRPSYRLLDPEKAKRTGGLLTRYEVTFEPA